MRELKVYLTTLVVLIASISLFTGTIALPAPKVQTQADRTAANQLLEQGNQQYQAGQLEAAMHSWEQAKGMYQQLQERQGEGMALVKLGAAYVLSERYRDAIATLESFLPIAQSLNNREGEAEALGNLGIAYNAVGNYSKAIKLHRQAGKILLTIGDRLSLGKVLLNLGNTFEILGDYDNATIAYQQSLKVAQQIEDPEGEGIALGHLGLVYANLGKYDEAIVAHKQSLAIAQAIKNRSGQASALINLGSTYLSLRESEKARSYYEQALQLAKTTDKSPSKTLRDALGNHLRSALRFPQGWYRKTEGEALGSLGLVYETSRDYPQAIQYQEQALAIAKTIGDPEAEGKALNNLGHALFAAGKLKEAEEKLRAAVKLLDGLRPGLDDTYKVSIFDTQVYTYNLLQQILVAANKPEAALEAAEQGRARAFAELLARRIYQEGEGQKLVSSITYNPPPSIDKIRKIARQQNATLVEYAIVPDDDFKFRGKQRGREQELFIWVVQPNGKVAFRRVDLKPLWQKGGTLADMINISHCFTLDRSANIDNCLSKTAGKGEQVMQALRQMKPAQAAKSSSKSQDFRQILHQLLIQPIADLLPTNPNAHVIFIPQETLFLVPFPALQDADGKYLIEKHTILTAPSIQVLDLTRNLKDKRRMAGGGNSSIFASPASALIVGNPVMPKPLEQLPQAEQEALDIAKLFKTTAIIGAQATKANILEKLPKARLVHLATHGLLEYGDRNTGLGIPGAIALAPSLKDNGFLTASEILNLRLNADLVVLSACKTGRGRISGDGVIGLSRALITAGTTSVVVSLWSVPDIQTAKLMKFFYQSLEKNSDKAAALRYSMLETMKEDSLPLNWAAFTLIGES
jgi:CHAT domain-containing protein/Flp pilus assembly protein TadD